MCSFCGLNSQNRQQSGISCSEDFVDHGHFFQHGYHFLVLLNSTSSKFFFASSIYIFRALYMGENRFVDVSKIPKVPNCFDINPMRRLKFLWKKANCRPSRSMLMLKCQLALVLFSTSDCKMFVDAGTTALTSMNFPSRNTT